MKIIVVGCGRVGAELAYRFYKNGHNVIVVDTVEASFSTLPSDFQGRMVAGDVLSEEVLHRAGFEEADGVAVVTPSDSLNAVVAHIAHTVYHVPHIVARNYNPRWRAMHETFGLQVVSSTSWAVQRIEELIYHEEMRVVFSAGNGEVEIYEITIHQEWEGRTVRELLPAAQAVPVALTRAGVAILPDGDTVLEEGDVLAVSATLEGIEELRRRLTSPQAVAATATR